MSATFDIPETAKTTQAMKLLAALREHGALTTTDGRDNLGIMHIAGRVQDLRAAGHKISTKIVWARDEQGRPHKEGLYTLMPQGTNHD